MALKRVHPDLDIKLSEILAQMPRPFSAPSTPNHSARPSPHASESEESDTAGQEEHENVNWHNDS